MSQIDCNVRASVNAPHFLGGNHMAGREISNDLIERKSSALAQMLDTGDGVRAANILRDEAQDLSPRSFNRLAHRTSEKEEKTTRGQGFDLEIVKDGTLIVTGGRKGETLAGHLMNERVASRDERVPYPSGDRDPGRPHTRPQPRTEVVECPKDSMVGDALKGAGVGAILGSVFGGDKRDITKGVIVGTVGGAIYNNEKDKG
jgi:outer membrane lipoprotein SlyB